MRSTWCAFALSFALGCASPAECADAGTDAGPDAWVCPGRLVLGPTNVAVAAGGLAGGGLFCDALTMPLEVEVRLFVPGGSMVPEPHGLVTTRRVSCGPSNFLVLDDVPPGEYDVTVESTFANASGAHVLVGTTLLHANACENVGGVRYECWPLRVTVTACDLTVVPLALGCDAPVAGERCLGPEWEP